METYLSNYFRKLHDHVMSFETKKMEESLYLIRQTHKNSRKILIFGNGGSAGIASHFSVDLTKVAGVRCLNFNEAALITCYGNDYGYNLWVQKALEHYMDPGDLTILISSSGQSMNMVNAANYVRHMSNKLLTLTGFKENNPLRQLGTVNLYVNSCEYNMVENTHQMWLLSLIDKHVEKK